MFSLPFMSSFKVDEINLGVNIKSFNKPNNYFFGGRFHIKNCIIFVCIVTCLRSIVEGFLTFDEHLYISSSDPKTMIFGSLLELCSVTILFVGYIKKNPIFAIPYIIVQIMFITIHGITLLLDILRCIWSSMPENPLLEYKQGKTLEYIRLLVIFSIFVVDCYCLKLILKAYVYLENTNIEFKSKFTAIIPQHQKHFSIEDEEIYSCGNSNFKQTPAVNENTLSDEDDLILTRDEYEKEKKSKLRNLNTENQPDVLTCDKSKLPTTWLWTYGHGILDLGTAGMIPDGPDYCIDYNKTSTVLHIQYHIDLYYDSSNMVYLEKEIITKESNLTNGCRNKDDRIHYCVPLCVNSTLEDIATKNALLYRSVRQAAKFIYEDMNEIENFVVTVFKVNFDTRNPAKIHQDIFFDPNYCSVYIGMQTIGLPYLYEIQIAKIYNSKKLEKRKEIF